MVPSFVNLRPQYPLAVNHLTFKVSHPDGQYGLHKIADTTFALGMGPCGRFVTELSVDITGSLLKVTQTSYVSEQPDPGDVLWDHHSLWADQYRPRWWGLCGDPVEYERHRLALQELSKAHKAWRDTCEIREFVYKVSDIHGRIVTTK